MERPVPVYILAVMILLEAIGAISGSLSLLFDKNFIPLDHLKYTPFNSYMIPAIILLVFLGIYPLFIIYALFKNPKWKFLRIYPSWAWTHAIYYCIIVLLWITAEIYFVGYFFLQTVIMLWAILMLILTLQPSVMKWYKII